MDESAILNKIDWWFTSRCNGTWEHRFGLTIETTDNPGWLLTFKEMKIEREKLAGVISGLLRDHAAQVVTDNVTVRVFAPTFSGCLASAAVLVDLVE